jgi:hypothetical protein
MFLYLLNDTEAKAFMEFAVQAMKVNGEEKDCEKAEYESYLTELNLIDYKTVGLSFDEAASAFKYSSIPVRRSVIVELCGILYADKEIDSAEQKWIYALSAKFNLPNSETERLVRWSKDFSDFLEIGLMYINAKE